MPAINEMGYVLNVVTNDLIPINGMDELDIERAQNWHWETLGLQSSTAAIWQGSPPVEFNLNFELLAGYGKVPDRPTLVKFAKWFHALAAHQPSSGFLAVAPPPVFLSIAGIMQSLGFMKNVRTNMQGPWEPDNSGLTTSYMPTVIRFSGTFVFVPGAQASDQGVQINRNNTYLNMQNVRTNFYSYSAGD